MRGRFHGPKILGLRGAPRLCSSPGNFTPPNNPTGIILSNSEIAKTASVGDLVGALLMVSGVEPGTFTLTSNPGGRWRISGDRLEVAASLSTLGGTQDELVIKVTDAQGREFETTLQITIAEAQPDNGSGVGEDDGEIVVPDPDDPETDQGGYDNPPIQQDTSGGLKITGKNSGSATWFKSLPPLYAGSVATFSYEADWSGMSRKGRMAAIGFAFKTGNQYHLSGVRGDNATPTKMLASSIYGDFRKANQFTLTSDGAVAGLSKDGPTFLRLVVSEDGKTYTLSAGLALATLQTIQTGRLPTPISGIDAVLEFGIGGYFTNQDKGVFGITITMYDVLHTLPVDITLVPNFIGATNFETLVGTLSTLGGTGPYTYEFIGEV